MKSKETHRNNHYVPVSLIKRWECHKDHLRGVHVHLIRDNQTKFWSFKKRSPYFFAVAEDLYVPVIDGSRATEMEAGWLNDQETTLARIIDKAQKRNDPFEGVSSREITRLEMSIFSLEVRSKYELEMIRSAVEADPDIRSAISANPERDTQRLVLENLIHVVTELHGNYVPLSFDFLHSQEEKFILTDRPSFVVDGTGRFLVLSDRLAVKYSKSEGAPSVEHTDTPADIVFEINKMLSIKARDWIIADNESVMQKYVEINKSNEANEYRENEHCEVIKPRSLQSGFSFR